MPEYKTGRLDLINMPIDDIDYLFENSAQDTHIIYVDSNSRDRKYFPKANSLAVRFSHPLKNVFGIDILDASVPSAMFNIDYDTNDIYFFTLQNSSDEALLFKWLQELGDTHGLKGIVGHEVPMDSMQDATWTREVFSIFFTENTACSVDDIFCTNKLEAFITQQQPPRVDLNKLLAADDPFDGWLTNTKTSTSFEIARISMPDVTLYDQAIVDGIAMFKVNVHGEDYYVDYATTIGKRFVTFVACFQAKYGNREAIEHLYNRANPPKRVRAFDIERASGNLYRWTYYVLTPVLLDEPIEPNPDGDSAIIPFLTMWHTRIRPGNYEVNGLLDVLDQSISTTGVRIDEETKSLVQVHPFVKFVSDRPFVMNMGTSTLSDVLGFDEYPQVTNNNNYVAIVSKFHGQLFGSKRSSPAADVAPYFHMRGPGLLNLLNLRYTILRCEELEDHLYGSYTYGSFSPGIGLFRFYDVNSQNHQRQDYVNFDKRPFHPIGKLDKLTIQFTLPDGKTLYDFKGLNYFLVLAIRYYVPYQTKKIEKSILNPNYDRNFQAYMYTHAMKRDRGSAEDDIEYDDGQGVGDDAALRSQLLQIQSKYDYESDSASE